MTAAAPQPGIDLASLRQGFDDAFAARHEPADGATLDMVILVAAQHRFGVLLGQVAGIHHAGRLAPMPDAPAGFLGIAATRLEMVPAYRLASVLGLGDAGGAPRLLMISRHPGRIAFVPDAFGGFERVPVPRFHRTPVDARAAVPCAGHASIGAERLPVLDLLALAGRLDRTAVPT